ncbi:SMR family transporter [Burkholderia contaminans]|uniref:SMR family transporter n=1 Tax=Burkholderia contaminans TaxID=488447 RepID=UPI001454B16E|nr:SMR family transporter [Burkholderia contaminans]VWC73812.1 multidrug transporter [Burkholderia contaminans]
MDKPKTQLATSWIYLLLAILAEVAGTVFMTEAARGGTYGGYVVMAFALALSYFFLSLSIRHIAVGIAYATWEGLGLVALTVIGVVVFHDRLSLQEIIGVTLAIVGIACVASGEGK